MLARRILLNFANLSMGELLSRVATFVAFAHLARALGAGSLGKIGFVTTVLAYLLLAVAQGFDPIGMREVARDHSALARYTANILTIRLLLATILYLGVAAVLPHTRVSPEVRVLILLFSLTLFPAALSLKWVFQALEDTRPVAAANIVVQVVFAVGCFAVKSEQQIYWVPVFRLAGELAATAGLLVLFVRNHGALRLAWDFSFWKQLMADSLPLALTSLLGTVQFNFDVLVLAWLSTSTMLGLYTAVSKVLLLFSVLLVLFQISLFPTLARAGAGRHDLAAISHHVLKFMIAACLPVSLACTAMAPRLVALLFGPGYEAAAPALQILIWTLPLMGVRSLYRQILVAHGLQRYELISMVAGSITSVTLNLALVPRFAVVGSAVASVLSTAAVLAFAYSFVHRHITAVPCARHLAKPLLAGAGMLAVAAGLAAAPLALQGAASLVTYVVLFFLFRGTTTGELRAVWKTTGSAG